MGLVQRDGINRLRHAMKYSRWFSTICVTLSDTGWIAGVGAKRGADLREIDEHSELVVIWGGNPVNTQVNVMTHAMKAKKRGAKLVVVDPYRTGTADQADIHLAVRPGTDGALAVGVHACPLQGGLCRLGLPAEVHRRAGRTCRACRDRGRPNGRRRSPACRSRRSSPSRASTGRARPRSSACHHGFSRSRNGAANMHAVTCLPAVTGAWQYKGGGALYGHTGMYPINKTLIDGLDMVDPSIRDLDQSRLGPILTNDAAALKNGPPVTGMLIQNTNPAMVCPELELVHKGFKREDLFACVHEQFMTETAAFADIVLPATMFLEHDDFYTASGHTFFQVTKAVIDAPGECRENHYVISELAKRLGAKHRGFDMTPWEIMDETLKVSNMWDAETNWQKGGQDFHLGFETSHFLDGFAWPDKKFRFKPEWTAYGPRGKEMPVLPGPFRRDRQCHRPTSRSGWSRRRRARSSIRPSPRRPARRSARCGRRR